MRNLSRLLPAALLFFCQCGSKNDSFPMQKTYWGPEDYNVVLAVIEFKTPQGEQYPNLGLCKTSDR